MTARRVLYLLSAAAAAAALLPVAVLLPPGIGAELALDARSLEILLNTVLLTVLTVVGAVLLGVPLALATACADLPLRRFWLGALTAPLAVPSYRGAFAWFAALGPGGEIEQLLGLATPRADMFCGGYSCTLAGNKSGVSRSTVTKLTAMATTLVCENPPYCTRPMPR